MFDYERFETDLVQQMTTVFHDWSEEYDDLYIFSLDCSRGMDSVGVIANTMTNLEEQTEEDSEEYWYYKYCEEEWDLFHTFASVSAKLREYADDNSDRFTNPETGEYSDRFHEHCDTIIAHCRRALIRFRQVIDKNKPDLLLTFHIREYLERDESIEIFQALNSENASKEYAEHIEAFA